MEKKIKPKEKDFFEKLHTLWKKGNFLCVGLDSDYSLIPSNLSKGHSIVYAISEFNREIVNATANFVCAYKLNVAFYEAYAQEGMQALSATIFDIKKSYPEIPIILDAKRGDIGNTNNGYVKAIFDVLSVDAVTVSPYVGKEALKPFLDRKDKGIFVLVKTSNPGAFEFQNLKVGEKQEPLFKVVAENIANSWNENNNCCVVVGASHPEEIEEVRKVIDDMPILIPGIGAQGGDLKRTVKAGVNSKKEGIIINSSRGIIFASKGPDFAQKASQEAKSLRDDIKKFL